MKVVLPILVLSVVLASGGSVLAHDKLVKIGVLTDLSGLYSDFTGQGSAFAAEMAIQDSGLNKKGWIIELVSADTQNKPDVSTNIARQWYDVGAVDIILDVPNSGIALAVMGFVKDLYRNIDTFGPKDDRESDVDQRVVRAKDIITEFVSENIQMTEIAEEVGFSVFSFIRQFAKAFGLSPCAWRTQARANEAAKLLREGKQAAEAAALSGFSDQSHMARTFKKVFGITPGQYCTMHMNTLRVGTRSPRYNS